MLTCKKVLLIEPRLFEDLFLGICQPFITRPKQAKVFKNPFHLRWLNAIGQKSPANQFVSVARNRRRFHAHTSAFRPIHWIDRFEHSIFVNGFDCV